MINIARAYTYAIQTLLIAILFKKQKIKYDKNFVIDYLIYSTGYVSK